MQHKRRRLMMSGKAPVVVPEEPEGEAMAAAAPAGGVRGWVVGVLGSIKQIFTKKEVNNDGD